MSKQVFIIPADLQIKDLFDYLASSQPDLASQQAKAILDTCACAINLEYVDIAEDESVLKDGDEVALIPPVSGG